MKWGGFGSAERSEAVGKMIWLGLAASRRAEVLNTPINFLDPSLFPSALLLSTAGQQQVRVFLGDTILVTDELDEEGHHWTRSAKPCEGARSKGATRAA